MSKEGLGPVGVGGPIRDITASESPTHRQEIMPASAFLFLIPSCKKKYLIQCACIDSGPCD